MVYTTDFAPVAGTAVFSLSPRGTSGERVGERGSSIVAHPMASTGKKSGPGAGSAAARARRFAPRRRAPNPIQIFSCIRKRFS